MKRPSLFLPLSCKRDSLHVPHLFPFKYSFPGPTQNKFHHLLILLYYSPSSSSHTKITSFFFSFSPLLFVSFLSNGARSRGVFLLQINNTTFFLSQHEIFANFPCDDHLIYAETSSHRDTGPNGL